MIISHKYKFIFIHIPRTGGSSTREALMGYDSIEYKYTKSEQYVGPIQKWEQGVNVGAHNTLSKYIQLADIKETESYFKWTRVRNPWDRIVSIYNRRGSAVRYRKEWPKCASDAIDNSFNDWVQNKLLRARRRGGPDFPPDHIFNQRKYIKNQGLDFVARFENIDEDFSFFCKKVGLPQIELPHINGYAHDNYKKYYNEKLIDELLALNSFREDLDYLNYDHQP